MKIIPVIDIYNGKVVHAVRGKRKEYRPIRSSLCKSINPIEVARVFKNLGFTDLYIADLDAITGASMNFEVLKNIINETGLKLMVDSGINNIENAQKLLDTGVIKIIIGTETLQTKNFVHEAVALFGNERVIVSLDLKEDKVLLKSGFKGFSDTLNLLKEFKSMGVSQVIVLDLAKVGSCEGVNVEFLKKIVVEIGINIYVGGGVRNINDLIELKNLGLSGVLIATSLHKGKIKVKSLKQEGFL
jgi:phosphoribosylformimino-5-aminoimidazole carboxamide ribotide isomerase